jgi:hypothetical protein
MNDYIAGIAIFLMVLSPLYIPLGAALVPPVYSGLRRITRAFSPTRPARRRA